MCTQAPSSAPTLNAPKSPPRRSPLLRASSTARMRCSSRCVCGAPPTKCMRRRADKPQRHARNSWMPRSCCGHGCACGASSAVHVHTQMQEAGSRTRGAHCRRGRPCMCARAYVLICESQARVHKQCTTHARAHVRSPPRLGPGTPPAPAPSPAPVSPSSPCGGFAAAAQHQDVHDSVMSAQLRSTF